MIPRFLVCVLSLSIFASAGTSSISSERLFVLLTKFKTLDMSDEDIAQQLMFFRLTDRLTGESLAVQRKEGYGPLTLRALEWLQSKSAAMPESPESGASQSPAPDEAKKQELLSRVSAYATAYNHALPNFLCVETTRFYTGIRGKSGEWHLDQKVTEDLRYKDGAEEYQTRLVNDRPSSAALSDTVSSFSRGELGSILSATFDPSSQTKFEWDHWETLEGKTVAVINYSVSQAHSQYLVCCVSAGSVTVGGVRRKQLKKWASAYRGSIYAEIDTGVIRRLTYRNIDIPPGHDLDDANNLLEFAPVTLGGKVNWLPRRVVHYTRQGENRKRSDIEFSNFHSFGADTTIQFPTEDQ